MRDPAETAYRQRIQATLWQLRAMILAGHRPNVYIAMGR
jgi:hypothetical protein